MPKRALTEKELKDKKITKRVDEFMKDTRDFLASKNAGQVDPTWEMSLFMLETYYREFVRLSMEIDSLPSVIEKTRYGFAPSPLLTARNATAVRLDALAKSLGLTLKSALSMNIAEPVKEESALEAFVRNKTEQKSK